MLDGSRAKKITFPAIMMIVFLMIISFWTPNVQAYTGDHTETFENNDYINEAVTNVTGLSDGAVSIPSKDLELVGSAPHGGSNIIVSGDIAYMTDYVDSDQVLFVYNVSNFEEPEYVTQITLTEASSHEADFIISNNRLYIPTYHGLHIFNITEPTDPVLLNAFDISESVNGVAVADDVAYVTAEDDALLIWNVTDPLNPSSIANYTNMIDRARDVAVHGNYAFLLEAPAFQIVNITDIYNPTQVVRIESTHGWGYNLYYHENRVYSTIGVFDVSNVSDPIYITSVWASIYDNVVQDDLLFSMSGYIHVSDITNISDTTMVYSRDLDIFGAAVLGDHILTVGLNNLQIFRFRDGTELWNLYEPYAMVESETVYTSDYTDMIWDVTLDANDTLPAGTDITYYVSATNGTWWTEVTSGVTTTFAGGYRGQNLKWRAELTTSDDTVTPVLYSVDLTCTVLLDMPVTTSPISGAELNDSTPRFEWEHVEGAEEYILEIDTSSDFDTSNLTTINVGYVNSYALEDPLADGQWYWHVAGIDSENQTGEFSPWTMFTLDADEDTTGTGGFNLQQLLPYIIGTGAIVAIVVIVVIAKKRGS